MAKNRKGVALMSNRPGRLPFFGEPKLHTRNDARMDKPRILANARVQVFDMSKPADREEYIRVYDMAYNRRATVAREEIIKREDEGKFIIFLRWVEWQRGEPDVVEKHVLNL